MGHTPPGARNPFSSIDQRTAYGAFKASGSFDPDVLYARKEAMVAPYKILKRLAVAGAIVGVLVASLFGMMLLGLPLVAGSWLVWRFQSRQVRNVEAGYAQYVGLGTD
jgi:hypothetical protein